MADQTSDVQAVPDVFEEFLPPIPFPVRGRDGNVLNYQINESDGGEDFWQWLNKTSSNIQPGNQPKENIWDTQSELIVQCITLNGKKVPMDVIRGWGIKCKQQAFQLCRRQCGIGEEEAEKEKKDSASEGTSGGGIPSHTGSGTVAFETASAV